ncbi:hypothetical protein J2128_002503 [Methanomicrobium sp. W14]|uniref:hypothetical protein n=1 Tax=Methanomicrobium sp. W14 TaxID=2817839 RepID=UPI001AE4FC13|nr:hypothetical protein [Methanomicrobium sp. W14]MBP2134532.1 hypothetical protein [Methanomicrobium sp. W14]
MRKILFLFLSVLIVTVFVMSSGCTGPDDSSGYEAGGSDTVTETAVFSPDVTVPVTESPSAAQTAFIPFFWPDVNPPYDDKTKNELIELAKKEILGIFPYVKEESLNGSFNDNFSSYVSFSTSSHYSHPCISFESADATTDNFLLAMSARGDREDEDPVEILVDGKTGEIVFYASVSWDTPSNKEVRRVSFEEAEKKSIEYIKKLKGEDYVNKAGPDFFTEKKNLDAENGCGYSTFERIQTYDNGVSDLDDSTFVRYDMYIDRLLYYDDLSKSESERENISSLIESPSVTLDEAKNIFESKLKEEYPGEDLGIYYLAYNSGNNLAVFDDYGTSAVGWYIYFNDKSMREVNGKSINQVVIDANTGEILSLRYRDIVIPPYTKEEKEIMAQIQADMTKNK